MDVESRKGAKGPKGYVPMAEKKTNNVGYCLPGFRTGLVSQSLIIFTTGSKADVAGDERPWQRAA